MPIPRADAAQPHLSFQQPIQQRYGFAFVHSSLQVKKTAENVFLLRIRRDKKIAVKNTHLHAVGQHFSRNGLPRFDCCSIPALVPNQRLRQHVLPRSFGWWACDRCVFSLCLFSFFCHSTNLGTMLRPSPIVLRITKSQLYCVARLNFFTVP